MSHTSRCHAAESVRRRSGRDRGVAGASLPRLSRRPSHGAPQRNPSGIPLRPCLTTRVRAVSTGFPPADAGLGPAAPATSASAPATPQWLVGKQSGGRRGLFERHLTSRMMARGPQLRRCGPAPVPLSVIHHSRRWVEAGAGANIAGGAGDPPRFGQEGKPEAPVATAEQRVPGSAVEPNRGRGNSGRLPAGQTRKGRSGRRGGERPHDTGPQKTGPCRSRNLPLRNRKWNFAELAPKRADGPRMVTNGIYY